MGYFGKDAMQLSIPECALLAGIIRAPTSSSPRVDVIKAQFRRNLTLKQMEEEKFITHEEYTRGDQYADRHSTGQTLWPAELRDGPGDQGNGTDSFH